MKTISQLFTLFIVITHFSSPLSADSQALFEKDLTLPKGYEMEVVGFNRAHSMIKVLGIELPGEGYSWIKAHELAEKVKPAKIAPQLSKSLILKLSPFIIAKRYTLTEEIDTYVIRDDSK